MTTTLTMAHRRRAAAAAPLKSERTARPGRTWLVILAALAIHLCIGQVYATSVYKAALDEDFGASLAAIGAISAVALVTCGLCYLLIRRWVERVGQGAAMFAAASLWSLGFLIGSLGIEADQSWLLFVGYGFIGGLGVGIGYISPVSTLIKWFSVRPALATGVAIGGFCAGALVYAMPAIYTMIGVLALGIIANLLIHPISKHFQPRQDRPNE